MIFDWSENLEIGVGDSRRKFENGGYEIPLFENGGYEIPLFENGGYEIP